MLETTSKLLTDNEWAGEHKSCLSCRACPHCTAEREAVAEHRDEAGLVQVVEDRHRTHRDGCAWAIAMAEVTALQEVATVLKKENEPRQHDARYLYNEAGI